MARDESHREDLLREATALVERIELAPTDAHEANIVAGFRANGALSIFFGEDPVYQFNAAGELRRAYRGDRLIKAAKGHLASLERVRTEREVQLIQHVFSDSEQGEFIAAMADNLRCLRESLDAGLLHVVRQVPEESAVLNRFRTWLADNQASVIAQRPNA
jgi:hypothetical protein